MGEHQDGGVHFVMVEEKRNILIGYLFIPSYIGPTFILVSTQLGHIHRFRILLRHGEDPASARRRF